MKLVTVVAVKRKKYILVNKIALIFEGNKIKNNKNKVEKDSFKKCA